MIAARAAEARGGVDTVVLDVGDLLVVTEMFVITHATSPRGVRAICDHVAERLAASGCRTRARIEGFEHLQWVLMDYGDFVVHVFDAQHRAFYQLERLWADSRVIEWQCERADAGPRHLEQPP